MHRHSCLLLILKVSTHSRAKAAERIIKMTKTFITVSTHSRAKAAEDFFRHNDIDLEVSTHSRAKAAELSLV